MTHSPHRVLDYALWQDTTILAIDQDGQLWTAPVGPWTTSSLSSLAEQTVRVTLPRFLTSLTDPKHAWKLERNHKLLKNAQRLMAFASEVDLLIQEMENIKPPSVAEQHFDPDVPF